MNEKRTSLRTKKPLVAMYTAEADPSSKKRKWDLTIIKDMNDQGMCAIINKSWKAAERLIFRVKIPFEPFEWHDVKTEVLSSQETEAKADDFMLRTFLVKVKFCDLNKREEGLLKRYVEWFHFIYLREINE